MNSPAFASLLGTTTPSAFVREYWNRRTAVFRGTARDLAGRFDRARLRRAIRAAVDRSVLEPALEVHVRAMFEHAVRPGDDPWMDVREIPVDAIDGSLSQGGSVCVHNICAGDEELARLTACTKAALSYTGDVGMSGYVSPPGFGLRPHFDAQAVLAIQIEGRKRWRVGARPCAPAPIANATLHADGSTAWTESSPLSERLGPPPPPGDLDDVVLEPGDAVFVPPGTWHATEALEASTGLVLYFRPITFAAMVEPMLWELFADDPAWRSGPPPAPRAGLLPCSLPPDLCRYFADRLRELARRVEDEPALDAPGTALARTWHRMIARREPQNRAPLPPPAMTLDPHTRVRLSPEGGSMAVEPGPAGRSIRVFTEELELELPPEATPVIETMIEAGGTTTADTLSRPGYGWPRVHALLCELRAAGLLAVEPGQAPR